MVFQILIKRFQNTWLFSGNEHGWQWKFTCSNRKYIFIHGGFYIAMLVYRRVSQKPLTFVCAFCLPNETYCTFKLRLTGKPTLQEDVYLYPIQNGNFPTDHVSFFLGGCTFKLPHAPKICWLETLGVFSNLHRFEPCLLNRRPRQWLGSLENTPFLSASALPQEETWQENTSKKPAWNLKLT